MLECGLSHVNGASTLSLVSHEILRVMMNEQGRAILLLP